MAKLSHFRRNSRAVQDGEWVRLEDFFGIEIYTRGATDQYVDALNAALAAAAKPYGGDQARIPNAERRQINIELLLEYCVMDVRNLEGDDGQPLPFAEFTDMVRHPDYTDLWRACDNAASRVGRLKAERAKAAEGNSAPPSTGT